MLTQADEARTETDRAGAREKVQLAILGSYGEDGTLDEEKLMTTLEEMPEAKVGEQNIQEKNLDVEVDGYTFEITKEGEVKDKGTVTLTPEIEEVNAGEIVTGSNKKYTDKKNKVAIIPVGFKVSEIEEEQVIDEGLVIKDAAGNEFVWIPVKGNYEATTTYENKSVSAALAPDEGYLPTFDEGEKAPEGSTEAEKEKNLVTTNMIEKYKVEGFYISRYEAGKESTNTLVSKKGANVWVDIPQETTKNTAKTFVVEDNTKVKSGLCTGIQWDMVMTFVNGKDDGEDQPYDVEKGLSSRHHSNVEQSGQNLADKVCNIYDLEGNCREYVAEKNTYSISATYVNRGGSYDGKDSASYRNYGGGSAVSYYSFRIVLYIM